MSARVFVDSNVTVYAEDTRDRTKRRAARAALGQLRDREIGTLSIQVLSETANVLTHPAKLAMPSEIALKVIEVFAVMFEVHPITTDVVTSALRARARWQLSYYDAQIWATAAANGIPLVLSEDFPDGLELGPVRFKNPFAEGFDLDAELAAIGA